MFTDVANYFHNNVLEAYSAYGAARDAKAAGRSQHMRAALSTAAALYHFREHLPAEHRKSRGAVSAVCPEYRLLADVTTAAKHSKVNRPTSEGAPLVSSTGDLKEVLVHTEYEDAEGTYQDSCTVVRVDCTDGVCRSLDEALTVVLNYWGSELAKLGIAPFAPRPMPELPGSRFVPRSEARQYTLEVVKGLAWRQNFQLLRFNRSTGFAEPIDLTTAQVSFKLYRPSYKIDVTATPPGGDEAITLTLDLDDDECLALATLETDAERDALTEAIVRRRKAEIETRLGDVVRNATGNVPATRAGAASREKR